jgi:hypothetical protein
MGMGWEGHLKTLLKNSREGYLKGIISAVSKFIEDVFPPTLSSPLQVKYNLNLSTLTSSMQSHCYINLVIISKHFVAHCIG